MWRKIETQKERKIIDVYKRQMIYSGKKEREELERRRARRRERLKDMGYSEDEFNELLRERGGSRRKGSGSGEKRKRRKKD